MWCPVLSVLFLCASSAAAFSVGGREAVAKAVASKLGDVSIDHVSVSVEEVAKSQADVLITCDAELAQHCKDTTTVLVTPKLILCADSLSYFFDRVYSGVPVPLPFEWRDLELSVATPEDCAQALTGTDGNGVFESRDGLASRPYTLSQLVRACGVAAGLDVIRTPYFSLSGVWFDKLAFPFSIDDTWLFRAKEDDEPKRSNKLLQRENLEKKRRQQLKEDDEKLAAALCALYDEYDAGSTPKEFETDKEFLKDGASLYGNVVYKNDKYHRQLGTPRPDNPFLVSSSSSSS